MLGLQKIAMNLNDWIEKNRPNFGSEYETLFAETVLPLVPELNFDAISAQYSFHDRDGRQRYCDFVIHEDNNVRISIEIDGYDKRGTGEGMSHADFVDWQRRQASLTALGWYVLRFANQDVRDNPKPCAEHISLLVKYLRGKPQANSLSVEEKALLDGLTSANNDTIKQLRKDTSAMKYAIASFTMVILMLVMVIAWQRSDILHKTPSAILQSAAIQSKPKADLDGGALSIKSATPAQNAGIQPEAITPEKVDGSYRHVLTSKGITCDTTHSPNDDGLPSLGEGGHFVCSCSTDMMCMIMNPHMDELSGKIDPAVMARAPKGTTCNNPINWDEAQQHIGQTFVVVGPLMKVTQRENVRGDPTWIDIGVSFPNSQRLMLVIWGNKKAEFPYALEQSVGKKVCVVGKISSYKGITQIELRHARQLLVGQ